MIAENAEEVGRARNGGRQDLGGNKQLQYNNASPGEETAPEESRAVRSTADASDSLADAHLLTPAYRDDSTEVQPRELNRLS